MTPTAKQRLLQVVLLASAVFLIFALPFMFGLWPGGFRWVHPSEHPAYERMIIAIYMSLGICLIPTAFDPKRHVMLINFTIVSSILHGGVMAYDAVVQEHELMHLIGDVPLLFLMAGVLLWLHPDLMGSETPGKDT